MVKAISKNDRQRRVASIQWVALLFALIIMFGCTACQGIQLNHESESDGSTPSGSSHLPNTQALNNGSSISATTGVIDTSQWSSDISTATSMSASSLTTSVAATSTSSAAIKKTQPKATTTKTITTTTTTTTTSKTTTTTSKHITVHVWVECKNAVNYPHLSDFVERMISEKRCDKDGNMVRKSLKLLREATAFDALIASGLDVKYSTSPGFGTKYIKSINTLDEKMAGGRSGWVYLVNGAFANQSSDQWILKDGDTLHWGYTIVEGDVN